MIIGSGMTFHNLRGFGTNENRAKLFDDWLYSTLTSEKLSPKEKWKLLADWEKQSPQNSGRFARPREEHLLPIHVCFGSSFPKEKFEDNSQIQVEYCRGFGMGSPLSCYILTKALITAVKLNNTSHNRQLVATQLNPIKITLLFCYSKNKQHMQ
ncbi:extradiol ring-cleavage dioxygenase III subunit B [Reticulomyxa filosa]|uniref:Extradiol ring-cleavage dioxygenase III subunit B n=1 Tax=Reticulomyxa filosa TaxID=46433 RepID=X6M658_RETFI|nr:extradiol ring-cleavage dioxygenase III subunit B [Reticulomyxa filosa]|eukprot:ETO08942.1 extradiol ring-cleavage dioxygenase III subunit B [Reticulomyxa filosa]